MQVRMAALASLFLLVSFAPPCATSCAERGLTLSWDEVYGDFPGHKRQVAGVKAGGPAKKLIEFGWDEPDTGFMLRHRDQIEASPFDGCVFHAVARNKAGKAESFTWLGWGGRAFSRDDLKSAFDDFTSIEWTKPRHDFLRFNLTPADIDWFDDHNAALGNARLAAQLARAGRCDGILLDTEPYQGKLFDYRKQRESGRRSPAEYATAAKRRGAELMTAFQDGFPGLTVFLTFGHSFIWRQSDHGKKPLSECPDGLLVPFIDGMIEAAKRPARIVDGHEMSYGYRDPAAFVSARETIKVQAATLSSDPAGYKRVISAAFGIWLDYDWQKKGWKPAEPASNYFSPARLETSLRAGLEQSDEYVWIYSEKPRWWSEKGAAVDLPPAYVEAVRRARRALGRE